MSTRRKFQVASIAFVAVLAALVGAFRDGAIASIQEMDNDHVDVGVVLEGRDQVSASLSQFVHIVVVNNGSRAAYDVNVLVDVVRPDKSHIIEVPDVPVGDASLERNPEGMTDDTRLRWTIPVLGGLQREVISITVRHKTPENVMPAYNNVLSVHEYAAEVTTASFDSYTDNNTYRMWNYNYLDSSNKTSRIQVAVEYAVALSVDQWNPAPGDTVNFTITASREQKYGRIGQPPLVPDTPPPIDLKVDIELTDGLAVTGTPSYHTTSADGVVSEVTSQTRTMDEARKKLNPPESPELPSPLIYNPHTPGSGKPRGGVFNIGTGGAEVKVPAHSVTLPVTVASDAVVSEQCLTATLTGNPPPGTGPLDDDVSDNVARICLDDRLVFHDGAIDLLRLFPCVGETDVPCNADDTVELAVETDDPSMVLPPDNAVVQVEDPIGRYASNQGVRWRTGNDTDHNAPGLDILPGVAADLVVPIAADGYSQHTFAITGSADNPGNVRWLLASNNFTVLDTSSKLSFSHSGLPVSRYETVFEFSALGTYRVDMTLGATHDSTPYTDTETYTFHVGPVADLSVSDGGPSPFIADDRNALTIVADNNGVDGSYGARVSGLPTGARLIYVSQGRYNSTNGEWDIGELRPKAYYSSRGEPSPTLILDALGVNTANVSIAPSENYKVCIGSDASTLAHTTEAACVADTANGGSWHEGTVYDHNTDNNAATITARAGTAGEPHPDASKNLSVIGAPLANILIWEPVTEVNGIPVAHYEIEYAEGGWKGLKEKVGVIFYVDMTDSSSNRANRAYRVRAVNGSGYPGPWTVSSGGGRAVPPNVPRNFTAALITDTDVELAWTAAEHGEALTHYTIQASDHAGGPWSHLARPNADATRWVHSNLPKTGAVKHYRIRAHNGSNYSAWAEASVSLTTPPEGATPSSLRAQRYTTREGNHGIQVWFTPRYTCDLDATDCLTLIEFREVGGAWRFGSENFGEYGIVPWGPDAPYFTQGDGREYAVRLDAAYDIRVCKLTEEQIEEKHAAGAAEGTWCVGHPTGQLRVPAGE